MFKRGGGGGGKEWRRKKRFFLDKVGDLTINFIIYLLKFSLIM